MRNDDERNPFGMEPEPEESVMDALYGSTEGLKGDPNRVVAKGLDVAAVWADVRQPRRAVPASVRLHWNGDPEAVPELLAAWREIAFDRARQTFSVRDVLQGKGEGIETDEAPAIFREYVELCRLAASINKDGLLNPITVVRQPSRHLIVAGERRWLAYWLLHLELGGNHAHIPAVETDGVDFVWKQAAENTARRQLNAIGMARQLALLIMEARTGIDGQRYDAYETLVVPGGCDRRFYAQVANGNIHKIPKGMGERIQAAMGLSMTQLSRYRKLLKMTEDDLVNDALWIRGDVEDWAEGVFREVSTLPIGKVREAIEGAEDWTLEDLRGLAPSPPAPSPTVGRGEDTLPIGKVQFEWNVGERVSVPPKGAAGTVLGVSEYGRVIVDVDGKTLHYEEHEVERQSDGFKASKWGGWQIGARVITPGGQVGRVEGLMDNGRVTVSTDRGSWPYKPEQLTAAVDVRPGIKAASEYVTGEPVEVLATGAIGMVLAIGQDRVLVDVKGRQWWHRADEIVPSDAEYAEYAPEPDMSGFDPGMAVLVNHTQEIGEIVKVHHGGVFEVDIAGTVEMYKRRELMPLMQTMQEFAEDEIESGEADFEAWGDDAPPQAPHPLAPSPTEGRGGTEQMKPDKADSVAPSATRQNIDNWLVWKPNSDERTQLELIASLARRSGRQAKHQIAAEVRDMTPAQIKRLAANGKLHDTLEMYHAEISELLVDWLDQDLRRILDVYWRISGD